MAMIAEPTLLPPSVRERFAPTTTFLNTATYGLAPTAVVEVVLASERARMEGCLDPYAVDDAVDRCRTAFGALVGVGPDRVAIGAQASQHLGVVAASLPAGAAVLVADGEFTSVTWPFAVRDDLAIRTVPLGDLVDAVDERVDLVVVSAVQSADGVLLDPAVVTAAAHAHGARVALDVTQAAGWFPLAACAGADFVVASGYKWLLGPRGAAFLAGTPEALATLRPTAAGWYAGEEPWSCCYGTEPRLAADARRFDVSPAWPVWLGQAAAFDVFDAVGIDAVHAHDVALANRLRAGLGLEPGESAIVAIDAPDGAAERLHAADVVASVRAGRLRLSCHLYNDAADVDRALDVLAG